MEYQHYPYPDESLYFAIHKTKHDTGRSLEFSRSKNQGIYVADSVSYIRSFIKNFAPGEESRLALCYSFNDMKKMLDMLNKKDISKVKVIPSFGLGKRKLWGYVLEDDVRKIRFYQARTKHELEKYLEKQNKELKAAFNASEVAYIIANMEKVKNGETDQYNFVYVEKGDS